jgi:Tol biopolymer transport system component
LFNDPASAPFYLYWSPDSQSITFLTQERSGLAMRLANAKASTNRLMAEGNPFYWVWSPAGDKLLMHVGGARAYSKNAHLSILENRAEADRVELNLAPGRFQAPDWSSDGTHFFYIAEDERGHESIYKTNAETLEQTAVTELVGYTFMVLSPDDKHVAYLQIEEDDHPPFGTAYIVDADGNNRRRLTDNLVGSIYWSPDGKRLALLTLALPGDEPTAKAAGLAAPLPQKIIFRWLIYDVETEEVEILTSFTPTRDFLQTVPYFDQYHRSLTFWSPDSRYFVTTKQKSGPADGTVWVYEVTGKEEPRQIGEGTLAVWSWG